MHPLSSMLDVSLQRSSVTDLPPAVELPSDLHPLPEDITQYFVYTFAVENHVLHPHPPYTSHAAQLEQLQQKRAASATFLEQRSADKETKRREALRRIAPGYNEQSNGILQPEKRQNYTSPSNTATSSPVLPQTASPQPLSAGSTQTPSPSTAAASELAAIFGQQKLQ